MRRREKLTKAGEVMFGDYWRGPMARLLEQHDRLVRRWGSGEEEVEGWVIEALPSILIREAEVLEAKAARIRQVAESIEKDEPNG